MAATTWAQEASLSSRIFPELETLYETAEGSGPQSLLRELNTREARLQSQISHSYLWPTLEAVSTYDYRVEERSDFNYLVEHTDYNSTATLTYPLYHWGAFRAAARQGRELVRQADLKNTAEARAQRAQIRSLYFDLTVQEKRLEIDKDSLGGPDEAPEATLSALEQESRRLDRTQRQLDIADRESSIAALKDRLAKILGANVELKYPFGGFPKELRIPEDWKAERLRSTPESQANESKARVEAAEVIKARAEGRPTVDLIGIFYQDLVDSAGVSNPVERNNYLVGVRLHWWLFNGWRTQAQTAVARVRQRRYREQARQDALKARDALAEDLRTLKTLAARYDIARARAQLSGDQLEAQETLKKVGQSSQESYSAAKRGKIAAEIAALEALQNFLKIYEKVESTLEDPANA